MDKIVFSTTDFDGVRALKLAETSFCKEIRISMQKGSAMPSHTAPSDICVQVLRGAIEFSLGQQSIRLDELDLITLKASEPHSLIALEDSIIRLSLAKNDSENRVKSIIS